MKFLKSVIDFFDMAFRIARMSDAERIAFIKEM